MDDRGIALPLALIGLLAVTAIVAGAALTSTSELALSGAHRDGVKSLYVVDGVLKKTIAAWADTPSKETLSGPMDPFDGPDINGGTRKYQLTATMLQDVLGPITGTAPDRRQSAVATYSVILDPWDGSQRGAGRSVGVFLSTFQEWEYVDTNITAGGTFKKSIDVGGNATVSDGSDGMAGCTDGTPAQHAIEVGKDATIKETGTAEIIGDTKATDETSADEIVMRLFGMPLEEFVQYAEIKFGNEFVMPPFPHKAAPTSEGATADQQDPQKTPLNWGCPEVMLDVGACDPDGDEDHFPFVVIDAQNPDGTWGEVSLNGDHGQGILIILNGNLRSQGNFVYNGIILTEGIVDIQGGSGGDGAKIEGALIGLGLNPDGKTSTINEMHGTPVIRYNSCSVAMAEAALNQGRRRQTPKQITEAPTAWFEVIR